MFSDRIPLILIIIIGLILITSILFRAKKRYYLNQIPCKIQSKFRIVKIYCDRGNDLANIINTIELIGYIGSILLLSFTTTDECLYLASFIDIVLVFLELFCSYYINKCVYEVKHFIKVNKISL